MILHKGPLFQISFGTSKEFVSPEERAKIASRELRSFAALPTIAATMRIPDIFFAYQTHSSQGVVINAGNALESFAHEGDFIVTNVPELGIGVLTADCLPIAFYDSKNHVIGITHAGWRGSIAGVGASTVRAMKEQYGTQEEHLQVFFGPSAKVCCYEVRDEVLAALEQFSFDDQVVVYQEDKAFFDMPKFNQLQLTAIGIKKEVFHVQYNLCTICGNEFSSSRRQGAQAGRQVTVIALK